MSCRMMTKQELREFYWLMGMAGQCIVIDGEQVAITSRIIPKPGAPEPEKAEEPNEP